VVPNGNTTNNWVSLRHGSIVIPLRLGGRGSRRADQGVELQPHTAQQELGSPGTKSFHVLKQSLRRCSFLWYHCCTGWMFWIAANWNRHEYGRENK
jgi:hypothetical protein